MVIECITEEFPKRQIFHVILFPELAKKNAAQEICMHINN